MDTTLRDTLVGRVLDGRYHVESRIASGGMATVYLALDRRLDREVALKVLHADLAADPEFVARFVREARSAARLSHPNVVQVFDQGADGELLYLAMEYLPGRTLRHVIAQRGALTPREALSVLEPVLDALAAAHRAGIMHRDVKPENVILTDDGRIKVADFGLARAAQPTLGPAAASGNRLVGTVGYLAPELVSRGVADARADVYAVGIVLFEMLTGRQPFTGSDPVAVAYRHVHETVPPPSLFAPQLPAELDDLVLSATSRDPDARPASAEQMLAAARRVHADLPADVLDLRPQAPATVALSPGAPTQLVGTPMTQQRTQALAMPEAPTTAAHGSDLAVRPDPLVGRLVPRLLVHEDDGVQPPRLLGDSFRRNRAMIVVGAVTAAILALVVWWVTAGPGAFQRTPETTGETVPAAQQILAREGLKYTLKSVYSNVVAKSLVVSSSPAAGERVHKGGTVTLNVSKGPNTVAVPDVVGQRQDDAVAALRAAHLVPGEITSAFNNDVPKGKVVSTAPDAGAKVAIGGTVQLVVSKGPEQVQLPNLTMQTWDSVKAQLDKLKLKPDVTEVDAGVLPAGYVVSQDPQPGTTMNVGDTVKLAVTKAREGQGGGNGQGNGQLVNVPDVTGKKFEEASAILSSQGFQVQRQSLFPMGDRVASQSPGGGQQAPQGSTVVLYTAF